MLSILEMGDDASYTSEIRATLSIAPFPLVIDLHFIFTAGKTTLLTIRANNLRPAIKGKSIGPQIPIDDRGAGI